MILPLAMLSPSTTSLTPSSVTRQSAPETAPSTSKVNTTEHEVSETLPPSGDEGEEEVWEENDSDDELQSTTQVASKRLVHSIYHELLSSNTSPSAQAALLRKNDVDVKGGWAVGKPFVFFEQKR